jgi:antitoxin component of RelBE/YafQ-DinJ toxin-antitoxin module
MSRKKNIPNMHHADADKITFRIDKAVKADFDRACFMLGTSMTAKLNEMISEMLREVSKDEQA